MKGRLGIAAACLLALAPAVAAAAPQTFNTALPVPRGELVVRGQAILAERGDDPTAAGREVSVRGGVGVLGYGVTGDLALFAAQPYLRKTVELTVPGRGRVRRRADGFGDTRVFARLTAWRADARGRTFRIAPFAGLELPTGADDERDSLGRLPPALQPGSGSWDPFAGVIATYQTLDFELDAQAAYQLNTRADGIDRGDVARLDAAALARVWPRELGPGVPAFVYAGLEANLVHTGGTRISGAPDPDDGATRLFLAPAVQLVTKRLVLEAVVQVPVWQDVRGGGLEDEWIVRAGLRVNF